MDNELIAQARKHYLAAYPLRISHVPAVTAAGEPMPQASIKVAA